MSWNLDAQQPPVLRRCLGGPCAPGHERCGPSFERAPAYHLMDQREFQIKSSQPTALNDDVVETKGDVNVFAGSISMQF